MIPISNIPARRVILGLILLLGLSLRLWGLDWGPGLLSEIHPGEWTWHIIESLSWEQPTYPGVWTQAFYTLAAMFRAGITWLAGGLGLLLGEFRTVGELALSALTAGRLTVALLGAGQVLLTYLVGRRYFDSVGTGLLAAGVVAVSPLLVGQSHYLSRDIPLGFAVLGCMWIAWHMVNHPRARIMALAGLFMGLTVTTRAGGGAMLPILALAFMLGVRQIKPHPTRTWLVWPAAFLAGLILGIILGYPGLILRADQTQEVLNSSLRLPATGLEQWPAFAAARLAESAMVIWRKVGVELVVLWLIGVALIPRPRLGGPLLLVAFPVIYVLAGVTALSAPLEGLVAVWLPVLAVLACWPLVVFCRRLPGRRWPELAAFGLGLLLCAWPLWNSLGMGYLFWQEDTFTAARFWAQANLPATAEIFTGPRTPLDFTTASKPLGKDPDLGEVMSNGSYVLLAPGRQTDPGGPASYGRFRERLQLLKRFDLTGAAERFPSFFAPAIPSWLNPPLEMYAPVPPLRVRQPLALFRPPVGLDRAFAVVFGNEPAYSREAGLMRLKLPGTSQRVLRLARAPKNLGLELVNTGEELAVLKLSQGPWPGRKLNLYPGQEEDLTIPARDWPPVARDFYPVKLGLERGAGLLAWLRWDPLLMARRALEAGRAQEARDMLSGLIENGGGGFDAQAMLAGACARLGDLKGAEKALWATELSAGEPAGTYRALAVSIPPGDIWDEAFRRLTGYHPDLLRQAVSITYRLDEAVRQDQGGVTLLKGSNFHGARQSAQGEEPGRTRLWLDEPFPQGRFKVDLHLDPSGPARPDQKLAEVEVTGRMAGGGQLLARRVITGRDVAEPGSVVELPVVTPRNGMSLEVSWRSLAGPEPVPTRLVVGVNLRAHMRHMLRWYLQARGKLDLSQGRFEQAVTALEDLLELDPGFEQAYLPLVRGLIDTGQVERAYVRLRAAESIFNDQPERLKEVRDLFGQLKKPEDVARVDELLAHLRPSVQREARFATGLSLLGYDLPKAEAGPGGELEANYYWRCWATPPVNYFVFVHLRGPGRTLTYDHLLDHGRLSMTNLVPGQVVREDYRLRIPEDAAPGKYRLVVGLWDPRFTGKGVMVVDGEGKGNEEVPLAEIEVKPQSKAEQ